MKLKPKSLRQEYQQLNGPREEALGILFHENSKLTAPARYRQGRRVEQLVAEELNKTLTRSYKSYPGHPQLELPRADLVLERGLQDVIVGRRSTREFDPSRPVTVQEVANLLQLSYGITGELKPGAKHPQYLRAIPSAGALYPLELYLVVQRVEGLAPGLYHYRVAHHALEALELAEQSERMRRAERDWGMVPNAAFYLVISASFERTMFKYQERGYRFVLMEAGMLGQSATLLAECQEIRSCIIGGCIDDQLNQLLGLDGTSEGMLLSICFGRARQGGRDG